MNRIMKLGLGAVFAVASVAALAQQGITVTVNGRPIEFSGTQPTQENGRVLVPLRGVFESMGAYVHWNSSTQTIDAQRENTTVELQIGSHHASVNGRDVYLDVPPELMYDTTMVPLRFVSEALGADVNWLDAQQTVAITTGGYQGDEGRNRHYEGDQGEHRRIIEQRQHLDRGPRAVIHANEVLPVRLNSPLGSDHSQVGDTFTTTLDTHGAPGYAGLPQGTEILGHVEDARPRMDNRPGILKVVFDRMQLPDGTSVPVHGWLIGLDNESVSRERGGYMVARNGHDNDTTAYIGYGAGAGAVLGLVTNGHVLTDAAVGGALGYLLHQIGQHPERAQNVYLREGTEMGVRISSPVDIR